MVSQTDSAPILDTQKLRAALWMMCNGPMNVLTFGTVISRTSLCRGYMAQRVHNEEAIVSWLNHRALLVALSKFFHTVNSGEVVMRNPFGPGVGGVLSADIAVPEYEREFGFYSRVLTTGKEPLWREDLTNNRGRPVIGLGARSPEYEALPLQWMPHFQVSDVGVSAARASELGGRELLHGKNEEGRSQWVVLLDPMGAAFGLIPVVDAASEAADERENVGRIAWLTLVASDVSSACLFYEQVVGWSTIPLKVDGGFEMRRSGGLSAAEIRQGGGTQWEVPPVWILSLVVDDLAESLRRVRALGGEVIKRLRGDGYAVIRDPVGVYLALQALE